MTHCFQEILPVSDMLMHLWCLFLSRITEFNRAEKLTQTFYLPNFIYLKFYIFCSMPFKAYIAVVIDMQMCKCDFLSLCVWARLEIILDEIQLDTEKIP